MKESFSPALGLPDRERDRSFGEERVRLGKLRHRYSRRLGIQRCHEGSEWKEDVPWDLIEASIDDQDYAIICCLDCGGLHCNCVKVRSDKRGGLVYQRA